MFDFVRSRTNVAATGAAALLLASGATTTAHAQSAGVTVRVDVNAQRRPISPLVYGHNYAGASAGDLNCPVNRLGGNNTSRYNWKKNADNRGSDWFFQSIADASPTQGERATTFVQNNKALGSHSTVW